MEHSIATPSSMGMKFFLSLLFALGACAPTFRVVTKRCPTTVLKTLDIGAALGAFAVSAIKWNNHSTVQSGAYSGLGVGLLVGAHLGEDKCVK